MIVRHTPVAEVSWGNGTSARFVTAADGVGFTVNDTVVYKNTRSKLQYQNHVEAVYCISGHGSVEMTDGTVHEIKPRELYVLDQHDAHTLVGGDEDWRVICVFTPALTGTEVHQLSEDGYSGF